MGSTSKCVCKYITPKCYNPSFITSLIHVESSGAGEVEGSSMGLRWSKDRFGGPGKMEGRVWFGSGLVGGGFDGSVRLVHSHSFTISLAALNRVGNLSDYKAVLVRSSSVNICIQK